MEEALRNSVIVPKILPVTLPTSMLCIQSPASDVIQSACWDLQGKSWSLYIGVQNSSKAEGGSVLSMFSAWTRANNRLDLSTQMKKPIGAEKKASNP